MVPLGEPGPEDDLRLPLDEKLGVDEEVVDVILAEVKEGKPSLTPMFRTHEALERALAREPAPSSGINPVKKARERLSVRVSARSPAA